MKKQFIILPIIFFAFLFSVSAEMTTEYIFKDSNGDYLDDVDIVVYNCLDANCQNVQIPAFAHTGNSNDLFPNYNIIVHYPRTLETSNGYAVYFYRAGYLPLEYFVTAYGDGTRTYERTFNKKQECRAPIDDLSVLNEVRANEPLVIDVRASLDATTHSAFSLTDDTPWYVPQEYKEEFYSALTDVVLTITNIDTGEVVFSESREVNIYADDSEDVHFTWIPQVEGNYQVLATTSVPDAQCASSIDEQADKEFRVLSEEPRNVCYTLLNNLRVDDVNPRVEQELEIQINKISNYADSDGALSPLPTNINLTIEKDDIIVYELGRVFSANPDSVNPVELSFSWAPEELGQYTISVEGIAEECPVADNQGESESIGLNVSIEPSVNHDPVFEDLDDKEVFEADELTFILEASDVDEDQLYFTSPNLPEGATLDRETGLFQWTPSHDFVSHTFIGRIRSFFIGVPEEEIDVQFIVSDNEGGSDSETITIKITDVNRNPVLEPLADITVEEGELIQLEPIASDADMDDLSFSFSEPFNAEGIWQTEIGDEGEYLVSVFVEDGFNGYDEETLRVFVVPFDINNNPEITSTPITEAVRDERYEYDVDAFDIDGDALTYSLLRKPIGMSIDANNGLIVWYPGRLGSYDVIVRVSDDENGFSEQSFTIEVRGGETVFKKSHKLSAPSLYALDDQIRAGESLVLFAKIKNLGSSKEKNVQVKMFIPDLDLVQMRSMQLQNKQGKLAIFEFDIPEDAKQGEYLAILTINAGKEHLTKHVIFEVK